MKTARRITLLLLALLMTVSLVACADVEKTGAWEDATYRSDKSFSKGEKTIEVEVIAEEQSITFTISTDKDNLAEAMLEHGLVEGEDSKFGLYIKKINGITADYDVDQTFWSLSKDGVALMVGASSQEIADGEHYEFTKAK